MCFTVVLFRLRHDRMKVNALFGCQRQSISLESWNCWVVCRICLAKVSGCFFFLSLSLWRGVCEFSILIPECNRASPCLENRWGIEARSITPLWTVQPFLHVAESELFTGGNNEERECEKFSRFVYKASSWFYDHINVAWRSFSLKGIFVLVHVYLKKNILFVEVISLSFI